jgi:hypothetical protein
MGDVSAPLGSKEEMWRSSLIPPLKGLSLGEPIKSDVELYSIKVLTVEFQPASLKQVSRIEDPLPVFVAVAAGAEKQPTHGATLCLNCTITE